MSKNLHRSPNLSQTSTPNPPPVHHVTPPSGRLCLILKLSKNYKFYFSSFVSWQTWGFHDSRGTDGCPWQESLKWCWITNKRAGLYAFGDVCFVCEGPNPWLLPAVAGKGRFQSCRKTHILELSRDLQGPLLQKSGLLSSWGTNPWSWIKAWPLLENADFKAITFIHWWKSRIRTIFFSTRDRRRMLRW